MPEDVRACSTPCRLISYVDARVMCAVGTNCETEKTMHRRWHDKKQKQKQYEHQVRIQETKKKTTKINQTSASGMYKKKHEACERNTRRAHGEGSSGEGLPNCRARVNFTLNRYVYPFGIQNIQCPCWCFILLYTRYLVNTLNMSKLRGRKHARRFPLTYSYILGGKHTLAVRSMFSL